MADPATSSLDTPSRRKVLQGLFALPAAALVTAACGSSSTGTTGTTGQATGSTTGSTTTTTAGGTSATPTSSWASGGTDLISVPYPDTSVFSADDACQIALTESTTEGPCYFQSDTGEDISIGLTGLPMQLSLQVIDGSCAPLGGLVVEVWHCDTAGVYSGDTSNSGDAGRFAGDFCTAGDPEAEQSAWYRGQLTTDSEGRVNFKTCFPGWYSGRTIHVHFAVSDPSGDTRVISQYCFPDEFTENICTTHELYADHGVQDTPLAGGTDSVFRSSDLDGFMFTTQQNSDGTLLAYSTIQVS